MKAWNRVRGMSFGVASSLCLLAGVPDPTAAESVFSVQPSTGIINGVSFVAPATPAYQLNYTAPWYSSGTVTERGGVYGGGNANAVWQGVTNGSMLSLSPPAGNGTQASLNLGVTTNIVWRADPAVDNVTGGPGNEYIVNHPFNISLGYSFEGYVAAGATVHWQIGETFYNNTGDTGNAFGDGFFVPGTFTRSPYSTNVDSLNSISIGASGAISAPGAFSLANIIKAVDYPDRSLDIWQSQLSVSMSIDPGTGGQTSWISVDPSAGISQDPNYNFPFQATPAPSSLAMLAGFGLVIVVGAGVRRWKRRAPLPVSS